MVFTLFLEFTGLTLWLACYAVIPTEENYGMVDNSFCLDVEYLIEFFVCLLWGFGIDNSEAVHHTVDMCIHSDVWHIIEDREDHLSSFDTYTWEGLDETQIVREYSTILCWKYCASFFDESGFIAEKVYVLEVLLYVFQRHIDNIVRITYMSKKWWGNTIDLLICCLC